MSLRVIGYHNGKRIVVDEGESYARVQGGGGAALGQAHSTFIVPKRSVVPLREKDRRRKERRELCGAAMGWRNQYGFKAIPDLTCYRGPGHKDSHRSEKVMARDTERRRSNRPLGGFRDTA